MRAVECRASPASAASLARVPFASEGGSFFPAPLDSGFRRNDGVNE